MLVTSNAATFILSVLIHLLQTVVPFLLEMV